MANSLDNQVSLESSSPTTPAGNAGDGPILWQGQAVAGGPAVTKAAIFTGTGVPVNSFAYWSTQGLVAASRAFYLREDGLNVNTMLYFTIDGGANWTPAAL